tara:strand:- start:3673 stop:3882 length:210 start_codon:yes stop_codon:yes gene_type:complete
MVGRKHQMDEVLRSLDKRRDVKVDSRAKVVEILQPAQYNDLGNKSWGKIDYLCNHNGYNKVFTTDFSRS